MRLVILLSLLITIAWSISNVFDAGTAIFNPPPNSVTQSVLDTVFDGLFQPTTPSNEWGVCTGQSSSDTASIKVTVGTSVKARTIFVTYTARGCTDAALRLDSTDILTMADCKNSLYYNDGSTFQATSLRLKVEFDPSSTYKKLCSPEILATDMHPLWKVNPLSTKDWSKKISDKNGIVIKDFTDSPEVKKNNWDQTCDKFNLDASKGETFQLYLRMAGLGNSSERKTDELLLLMGYFLVLGRDNRNSAILLQAYDVTINFAAGFAVQTSTTTEIIAKSSGIHDIDRPNGQIIHSAKIWTNGGNDTQICRFMPLGYPCCYVDSITDTTVSSDTFFIHPNTPKAPIQKVFQIGFYIDFAKTIENVLFCSLGLTATVSCTTCPQIQPVVGVTITEDGKVTVSVSSTSFTNIGAQTFQMTVIDSRNLEQSSGMKLTFQVTFTTCSLAYSAPQNVNYKLRDPQNSQTIATTESDTCLFTVSCSLGSGAPTWVSNTGCNFSWSTSDTTALVTPVYTVPITISYAKLPIAATFTTSFTITLSCVSTNSFPALSATYTIGDTLSSLTLQATNTCGYTMIYSYPSPSLSWVSLSNSIVSWHTTDISIQPAIYTATFVVTFSSVPPSTLSALLTINVLACAEILTIVEPAQMTYTIWDPKASQAIQVSDGSACGYVPSCSLSSSAPSWVTISNCVVSWQTNQNSVLTTASSYLISIVMTLHDTQQNTQFSIELQPCKPTYSIQAPSNANYELFTAAATQQIIYTLTSSTTCGYIPVCSLTIAPQWVSVSNCVVQWQSNSTIVQTPSTNQVKIQLDYYDYQGVQNFIGQTDFYIKVTPALSLCTTATLTASNTSLIKLEYNRKGSYDLTPLDSVSTLFAKPNYCGAYTALWPSSPVSWLTFTTNGLTLELLQSQYNTENANVQIQFSLANYPAINTTLNLTIQPKSCSVQAFNPAITSISVDYSISEQNTPVNLPAYTIVSDCELSFAYSFQVDQLAGDAFDLNLISISTTLFEITINDESFAGKSLQFVVTATLNDKSLTTNSDLIVTVKIAPISDESDSNSKSSAGDDPEKLALQNDTGPQFSSQIQTADAIPCLNSEQAGSWEFQTPQVVQMEQKIVNFEVKSPEIEDIFEVNFDGEQATFSLSDSSAQPYPGFYPASIILNYQGEKIETKYAISFVIDCDAKFATTKLQTRPQPRIQKITGSGLVYVFWNQTLLPVSNFAQLNSSDVVIDNKAVPSLQVTIKPGTNNDQEIQVKFNFSVIAMDTRSLTLQLYFENPAVISKSSHSLDQLTIIFNEASMFVSQANKMSVQQGLSIQAFLPRQQLDGQVQFKIGSAVGVSKGAMLASLGMPYVLSSFLSQLLSVVRSFTLIVHMQTISLMCPANVVAFFSVLAPLVMFDLVPTQDIANKIFKFDEFSKRAPLSLQFGQLGYPSLLLVENMGSLFFMICALPCAIIFCLLLRKLLSSYISGQKIGKKVIAGLDFLIKSAFWNFPINCLFESYLVICVVSFIGIKGIVFSDYYLWTQVFCSVLALIGVATCLIFPVAIVIVYKKMLKNSDPLPDPTEMTVLEREAQFWIDDVDSILDHYFTQKQFKEFISRYGCLVEDVDLKRVGVNAAILVPISDILRKLIVSAALVFMVESPCFVIFTFNFTTLIYISTQLYLSPLKDPIENTRILLNEITVLLVVYHMFCFSDFVEDIQAQNSVGNSLIQIVLVNGSLNVILSLVSPFKKTILLLKRYYFRWIRKSSRLTTRQTNKAVANQSDLQEEQAAVVHKALQRAPIVENSMNGFRVADTTQPFTTFQMPQLGNISPVSSQLTQLDQTRDGDSDQSLVEMQTPKRYATNSKFRGRTALDSIKEENEQDYESCMRNILRINA